MKIVVIGGSGRIGEKLVRNLRQEDCRVFEASRSFGVDAVTGAGLEAALEEADIIVDVSNSPSLSGEAPLRFFEASTRNIIAAGTRAGIAHHIVLSIVGLEGLATASYFRAKKLQEELVAGSGTPFTIVRSTQFFEFISAVVQEGSDSAIPIAPAVIQPISGDDLADALSDAVFNDPFNRAIEVAGPQQLRMDEIASEIATAFEDTRRVVTDAFAPYLGASIAETSLLPRADAYLGRQTFDDWLRDVLQPNWAKMPVA